jgi:prephenate dehydrogenase
VEALVSTLAIIGLGLIGSSLSLAVRRGGDDIDVVGYDKNVEMAQWAQTVNIVPRFAPTVAEAVSGASMVVVATPIISMSKVFEAMAPHLQRGTVVTDTASTKTEVMRWARELLPAGVEFVGGHPMAGKEQSGAAAAEPTLFDGRPYCVVPALDAKPAAVGSVLDLARRIGANPFFLDAAEHDAYAAAISHTPLIASIGLFNVVRNSAAWPELAAMAGPGFRDLTRLASGSPEMTHDIALTNRENLLHWLDRYITELYRLRELIDGDDAAALYRAFAEAQLERDNFITNPTPQRNGPVKAPEMPSGQQMFYDVMIGGRWRERAEETAAAQAELQKARDRERRLRRQE